MASQWKRVFWASRERSANGAIREVENNREFTEMELSVESFLAPLIQKTDLV
jgi:hypothetical protein